MDPEYDERGHLTPQSWEAAITAGGGVSHQGKVYTRVADIPTAAALAQGNPAAEAQALAAIDAQIAALATQRASLSVNAPAPGKPGKPGKSADEPDAPPPTNESR